MLRFIILFFLLIVLTAQLNATQLSLPITLDYPILRSMILERVFIDENQSFRVIDENDGCTEVVFNTPSRWINVD